MIRAVPTRIRFVVRIANTAAVLGVFAAAPTASLTSTRDKAGTLFDRNCIPHMLGWYLLSDRTTMPEMERMLARAAGYGADFAMVARLKALRTKPLALSLLGAIREWEYVRMSHAFSAEQRERLKNPRVERQPGEPTQSSFTLDTVFDGDDPPRLELQFRGLGKAERVRGTP